MRTAPRQLLIASDFDAESEFCADHSLQLERSTGYGWLVRLAHHDRQGAVIGCIDQLEQGVELMLLDGGFRWSTFASLREALENLMRTLPQPGDERIFHDQLDQDLQIGLGSR